MGKKHFCFFQTAETGNRTPNSGVKGGGANHYPRAPAHLRPRNDRLDFKNDQSYDPNPGFRFTIRIRICMKSWQDVYLRPRTNPLNFGNDPDYDQDRKTELLSLISRSFSVSDCLTVYSYYCCYHYHYQDEI